MTWTFMRDGQKRHCEIRRDSDGQDYEFAVKAPDGSEQVERFDNPTALIDRSAEYFKELVQDGWLPLLDPR
jgi:hypothetical protein